MIRTGWRRGLKDPESRVHLIGRRRDPDAHCAAARTIWNRLPFDFYPHEESRVICKRSAEIINIEIDDDGAREIARRSRGTPRIVNRSAATRARYAEWITTAHPQQVRQRCAKPNGSRYVRPGTKWNRKLLLTIIENLTADRWAWEQSRHRSMKRRTLLKKL